MAANRFFSLFITQSYLLLALFIHQSIFPPILISLNSLFKFQHNIQYYANFS